LRVELGDSLSSKIPFAPKLHEDVDIIVLSMRFFLFLSGSEGRGFRH
jgi:hypothetical protein